MERETDSKETGQWIVIRSKSIGKEERNMKKTLPKIVALTLALAIAMSSVGVAAAKDNKGVDQAQSALSVLAVRAPRVAQVGEPVTMTVVNRDGSKPVGGAFVYALSHPKAELATKANLVIPWNYRCEFLGKSGGDGEVSPTPVFEESGRLLIIATKNGWGPGLAKLRVAYLRALVVTAMLRQVEVDDTILFTVTERESGEGIGGAHIYALRLHIPRSFLSSLYEEGTLTPPESEEAVAYWLKDRVVECCGILLGTTEPDGTLKASFDREGRYMVVALHRGYRPGRTGVAIGLPKALAVTAMPRQAEVDDTILFTVTERESGEGIGEARIYALCLPIPRPLLSPLSEKGTIIRPESEECVASWLEGMVVECYGIQLGTTEPDGTLEASVDSEGKYLVVALHKGYGLGRTGVVIGPSEIVPRGQSQ